MGNTKIKTPVTPILLFVIAGGIIGSAAYVSFIPQTLRTNIKVGMTLISLISWMILHRNNSLEQYKQIAISFFSISLGLLLAQHFGNVPLKLSGYSIETVQGVAMAKFGEALLIVLPIIVLHFATGGKKDGLFLSVGNRKLTMVAGTIGFMFFVIVGYLQTQNTNLRWNDVANALPWILIFIFSNAFLEELWFRALFLKKLEPLIGASTTIVITSIVFATVHISATYVPDIIIFMVILMVLALFWGWLMRKSNSIWGPTIIHAGADILVILGFLAGAKI